MDGLTRFLVEAKKATYANVGEGEEARGADGSKTLRYARGEYSYHDAYYGSSDFAGQETVFWSRTPVWAMNYYGSTLEKIDEAEVYRFLKRCLLQVGEDAPYRGPKRVAKGSLEYSNAWEGTIEKFFGKEAIMQDGRKVYELRYGGGKIG